MKHDVLLKTFRIPGWKEFYIEYTELKQFLKEAREKVKIHRQASMSSKTVNKISPDNSQHAEQQEGGEGGGGLEVFPEPVNFDPSMVPENKSEYGRFKHEFKNSLQKAETFYKKIKEDLIYDFNLLKQLVDELIDKDVRFLV
jgi:hypothetical protein